MTKLSAKILFFVIAAFSIILISIIYFYSSRQSKIIQPMKPKAKTVSILGNSIVKASPQPSIGWNGDWGMAATALDKDFSHILIKDGIHVVNIKNYSKYVELEPGQHPLNAFKDMKADIVILKFGENVNTERLPAFIDYYQKLVDYFASNKSKVVCVNSYWDVKFVNDAIGKVKNCEIVDVTYISKDGANSDNNLAGHPNDRGMELIAKEILKKLRKM